MQPVDVPDGSFQYTKLASAGDFFNWGIIDLRVDQMKRTKNSRKMHMIFTVQSGTVEVKVHENEFTVHRGGVWQVPRGMLNTLSFPLPEHAVPEYNLLYLEKGRNMDGHRCSMVNMSPLHVCNQYCDSNVPLPQPPQVLCDGRHFTPESLRDIVCSICV